MIPLLGALNLQKPGLASFGPDAWWIELASQGGAGDAPALAGAVQLVLSGSTLLTMLVFFGLRRNMLRRDEIARAAEASRLQTMLQASSVGAILSGPRGTVRWFNPRAAALLGIAQPSGKALSLVQDANWAALGWQKALDVTTPSNTDLRWAYTGAAPDGRELDIQITATPLPQPGLGAWLFELIDLSESHRRERELAEMAALSQKLQESAERSRALAEKVSIEMQDLYDNAPCGYHSLDSAGRVISMNAIELDWLGRTPAQVLGKPLAGLLSPSSVEPFRLAFRQVLGGQALENLQMNMLLADGSLMPVSVNASLARDASGEVAYVRMTVFDISEGRQRELELALARDQAQVVSQAKSQFLAIMSHEIRTPLNWVMGMLQVLGYRRDLSAGAKAQVDTALQGSEVLLSVLNDVLDFSSLSSGKFVLHLAPGRVFAVMSTIKALIGQLPAKPRVSMCVTIDPKLVALVELDAMRLRQVLLNLVNNAIKYTEEGSIKVSARVAYQSDQEIGVDFAVQDSGIGMSEQTQSNLFQPFMQADMTDTRRFSGAGLGLAISKDIVAAMGGELQVRSQLGVGTLAGFTLVFALVPVSDEPGFVSDSTHGLQGPAFQADKALRTRTQFLAKSQLTQAQNAQGQAPNAEAGGQDQAPEQAEVQRAAQAEATSGQLAPDASSGRQAYEPVTDTSLQGLHVLVVDDQEPNLLAAQAMLDVCGARVSTAPSGESALSMLRQAEPMFDAVLMDLQMDGMDGLEATRCIRREQRAELRAVPVLSMTGKLMDHEREKTARAGMNGFLAKPVDMVAMVREIQRVIKQRKDSSQSE
jgi:PAS domain S-box-containing protein